MFYGNSYLKGKNFGWISSKGFCFWNDRGYRTSSSGKVNKDFKRKRNSRRELQGRVNHCSKTFSDSRVVCDSYLIVSIIKKPFLIPFLFVVISFLFLLVSFIHNRQYIYPSELDTVYLKEYFGEQYVITSKDDILEAQNFVIDMMPHQNNRPPFKEALDLSMIVKMDSAHCFERSFLLQKLFLANNFKVRPVFVYWNDSNKSSVFDLIRKDTLSHNIFEVEIEDKWYVIETQIKINHLVSIENYNFNSVQFVPSDAKYVRHIFSRNGVFLYPSFFPDIY